MFPAKFIERSLTEIIAFTSDKYFVLFYHKKASHGNDFKDYNFSSGQKYHRGEMNELGNGACGDNCTGYMRACGNAHNRKGAGGAYPKEGEQRDKNAQRLALVKR